MTAIPPNTVTLDDLIQWYKMQKQLAALKASEMLLRTKIAKAYFPTPKEGTNTAKLQDGASLKVVHSINRKVDVAMLTNMDAQFREKGINPDNLIERKPELKVAAYRELTAEQQQFFDQALIISDGSPQMKIEAAKPKPVAGDKA